MTHTASQATELGELLRSRRERLQPSAIGLPQGVRRRTPGLRREEVAQLASISATYYAFLEQGRGVRPSRQVLDALAAALRLDADERTHVHQLVHGAVPVQAPAVLEALTPSVTALVDRLDPCPTYVTGKHWDVLASNKAARTLWTDWPARPPQARNMLWWMFADPDAQQVMVEWEQEASALLGRLRTAAARHPGDPGFADLLERLHAVSPEVRAWWPQHKVVTASSGTKQLRHPDLGELTLHHVVLQLADNPEHKLVTYTASDRDQIRIRELLAAR